MKKGNTRELLSIDSHFSKDDLSKKPSQSLSPTKENTRKMMKLPLANTL
jgi:hypothetical protein